MNMWEWYTKRQAGSVNVKYLAYLTIVVDHNVYKQQSAAGFTDFGNHLLFQKAHHVSETECVSVLASKHVECLLSLLLTSVTRKPKSINQNHISHYDKVSVNCEATNLGAESLLSCSTAQPPSLMKPRIQEPTDSLCSEPRESSPHPHTLFL